MIITINNSKIKYIKILDMLYEVDEISFFYFTVSAKETDRKIQDVPAEEIIDLTGFKDFKINMQNWRGNLVDFKTYVENRKEKS